MQQSAVESKTAAQSLLSRAIHLYRSDFLTSLDLKTNPWVQGRRDELSQLYGEALFAQGKLVEQSGNVEVALGLFIRASALNRQREDLAGIIMGLYRDLGMLNDALLTYERIEFEISTTLGISPAQWLQDLAANIREHAKTVAAKISE
jgi:two-component SAPR family response regulator